ncbi:uncharacterized protein [Amphiura filiformis]|uniref:uncharacterized protein n=1 Tax=Amphiura filiformis TaxID=82378 RepID=UPI003B228BC5
MFMMFWGLTIEPGKHYTQTVEESFHVSMAAMETRDHVAESGGEKTGVVQVIVKHEKAEFLVCSLFYGTVFQQPLDLNFTEGEEVTFFTEGRGIVHLTGYLVKEEPLDIDQDMMSLEDASSSEDIGVSSEDEDEADMSLQQLANEELEEESEEEEEDWSPNTGKKRPGKKKKLKKAAQEATAQDGSPSKRKRQGSGDAEWVMWNQPPTRQSAKKARKTMAIAMATKHGLDLEEDSDEEDENGKPDKVNKGLIDSTNAALMVANLEDLDDDDEDEEDEDYVPGKNNKKNEAKDGKTPSKKDKGDEKMITNVDEEDDDEEEEDGDYVPGKKNNKKTKEDNKDNASSKKDKKNEQIFVTIVDEEMDDDEEEEDDEEDEDDDDEDEDYVPGKENNNKTKEDNKDNASKKNKKTEQIVTIADEEMDDDEEEEDDDDDDYVPDSGHAKKKTKQKKSKDKNDVEIVEVNPAAISVNKDNDGDDYDEDYVPDKKLLKKTKTESESDSTDDEDDRKRRRKEDEEPEFEEESDTDDTYNSEDEEEEEEESDEEEEDDENTKTGRKDGQIHQEKQKGNKLQEVEGNKTGSNKKPKNKQGKKDVASTEQGVEGISSDKENMSATPGGKVKNGNQESAKKEQKKKPKQIKLKGGITIQDLVEGKGKVAKQGRRVFVYYRGKLESNNKQFDACVSGPAFDFRLGKGEVIKGWDTGVAGMRIGGKRVITVPPSQGYGSQREGPIPGNSTLIFEVELKNVK